MVDLPVVLGVALLCTAIALAGTLLMATSARAPGLASLRRAGVTQAAALLPAWRATRA
ncbi:hypothetical protein OG905_18475 [Streptomyces sp. NBC_00322]|uniref:hypothetical protein n=1 Tax=Streptomyces sp. NBC_00322 TaxID=2975712 RepID=UPI002E2AC82B|nr:hypothetical protein [Streptomyces sp. NBC_00322]